ncbi:hypothetical protein [Streptomyces sp. sk2.1]|uniref:hypothetical protein n=1 Tax=Streptomyces sp. sk2.1 TaxID=2478959 RepID=UPI0016531DA4
MEDDFGEGSAAVVFGQGGSVAADVVGHGAGVAWASSLRTHDFAVMPRSAATATYVHTEGGPLTSAPRSS